MSDSLPHVTHSDCFRAPTAPWRVPVRPAKNLFTMENRPIESIVNIHIKKYVEAPNGCRSKANTFGHFRRYALSKNLRKMALFCEINV